MIAVVVAPAALVAACGGPTAPSHTGAGPRPATSAPTAPAPATASAATDLAPYVAAARAADRALRAAAAAVNGGIAADAITVTPAIRTAVATADPSTAAAAIPAGLTASLARPVLLVQSDLVSRYRALRGYLVPFTGTTGTANLPRSNPETAYGLQCLSNGSEAAARFADDLAALRQAADRAPPVTVAAPDSTAAADLAIWLYDVDLRNAGCGGCGGERVTTVPVVTWHRIGPQFPGDQDWDGDVDGIPFRATYTAASGWTVVLQAC